MSWQDVAKEFGFDGLLVEVDLPKMAKEIVRLRERVEYWQKDSAAAWDTCEKHRIRLRDESRALIRSDCTRAKLRRALEEISEMTFAGVKELEKKSIFRDWKDVARNALTVDEKSE